MLGEFQNLFQFSITVGEFMGNLIVASLCGLIISTMYRVSYRGPGYPITFLNSLVALAMITAIVIMVIGNNLARAFGLVGAMSIIRFRTALKDTQDIVFVFFSLAMGMAAGVGLRAIAISGTLFVGATLYLLSRVNTGSHKKEFLLQFNFDGPGDNGDVAYLPVLSRYCRRNKIINAKSVGTNGTLELSFYVDLKREKQNTELVRALKRVEGVNHVNLFFDEEHF